MKTFITQRDFEQAALDFIALSVSERASSVISTGNVADIGEETLQYLEMIALDKSLSVSIVSTYLDIIRSENEEIRNFFDK